MTSEISNAPDGFQCGTGRKAKPIADALAKDRVLDALWPLHGDTIRCKCGYCLTNERARKIAGSLSTEAQGLLEDLCDWITGLEAERDDLRKENTRLKSDLRCLECAAFPEDLCADCENAK